MDLKILIIIIVSLLVYIKLRNLYYAYLKSKTEYNLHKLLCELEEININSQISRDEYIEIKNMICTAKNNFANLNLWIISYAIFKITNNGKLQRENDIYRKNIARKIKSSNYYGKYYIQVGEIQVSYVINKHFFIKGTSKFFKFLNKISFNVNNLIPFKSFAKKLNDFIKESSVIDNNNRHSLC